jgi:histidinol phosphatase-like enzyme
MDINTVWSAGLTVVIAVIGYFISDKFSKLERIDILLNKTREEIARDYVTQSEVQRITDHIDQRFNKLEAKIDQLIQAGK